MQVAVDKETREVYKVRENGGDGLELEDISPQEYDLIEVTVEQFNELVRAENLIRQRVAEKNRKQWIDAKQELIDEGIIETFNLGMMIVQTGRPYDVDMDVLLANGFTEFREIPSYQTTGWVDACKAALLRNIPKGAKYIWGVSSNRFDNPAYVITEANWNDFRLAILDAAQWAQDNGVYEFQIGNEEEWHTEGPHMVSWIIGKMKEVATEAKQLFTNGNISYSCAHSYIDDWCTGGKGDIDILASNIYMDYNHAEPVDLWKEEIDKLVNAFGDDTYLTEFAISSVAPEDYSTDEDTQATATKEILDYIKARMKRAIYFVWYHEVYGGVVKPDGSYRKLWDELK